MPPENILLIDDDIKMKSIVADVLQHEGFSILTAMNGQDALRLFSEKTVDLVLLDVKLPDIDGIELLKRFLAVKPLVPVIMISGFATIDRAVLSTKLGAYDFLEKPVEPRRMLLTIKNALERGRLENEQQALVEDMMHRYGVIGMSDRLRKLCLAASRIARLDTPVLLTGENGTGKELIATVIHSLSNRRHMVCVNCAAVPRELIESELFGHRKGAFTGAISDKIGKFQAADGGTLFLDEIGDMSDDMQAKILRALEVKMVCMVGGNEMTRVDVRVIAATNKNLEEAMQRGKFREDLYYRLRGVALHVPSLRERPEDIRPLAKYFLDAFCTERSLPGKTFTESAFKTLEEQEWRGNVRELKHFVENLGIFSDEEKIGHLDVISLIHSLAESSEEKIPEMDADSLYASTQSFEKNLILKTLRETDGNITQAAAKLKIDRATLSKKIKRMGLKD